jgi:ubiquinone/menaquinone biosynthesis C-methylase UbiE
MDNVALTIPQNPLECNALASVSALDAISYKECFKKMESEQERFLEKETQFRSPEYIWPRDALHNWSRIWEYPFVYHHLRKLAANSGKPLKIADIGCGVTFFPFTVAKLGYDVVAVDVDSIVERDMRRAIPLFPINNGSVSYKATDGHTLPFAAAELDAMYCISVLEHVNPPDRLVSEMARVLKSGGLFVLTIDLALETEGEILAKDHMRLMHALEQYFEPVLPNVHTHPADMLTTSTSPFRYKRLSLKRLKEVANIDFFYKQLLKPMISGQPIPMPKKYNLAVQCLVLRKRA